MILGVTPNERALRRMSIYWGVVPLKSMQFSTTDDICNGRHRTGSGKTVCGAGGCVVLTAGIPSSNILQERNIFKQYDADRYGGIARRVRQKYKKEKNNNEQKAICDKRTG